MGQNENLEKLIAVKQALADKYERLARATGSRPRRKTFLHHAGTYRQQAADLAHRPKKP